MPRDVRMERRRRSARATPSACRCEDLVRRVARARCDADCAARTVSDVETCVWRCSSSTCASWLIACRCGCVGDGHRRRRPLRRHGHDDPWIRVDAPCLHTVRPRAIRPFFHAPSVHRCTCVRRIHTNAIRPSVRRCRHGFGAHGLHAPTDRVWLCHPFVCVALARARASSQRRPSVFVGFLSRAWCSHSFSTTWLSMELRRALRRDRRLRPDRGSERRTWCGTSRWHRADANGRSQTHVEERGTNQEQRRAEKTKDTSHPRVPRFG
mmetsp:Transcript_1909/g.11700  ORF Transcript_1909/g.11700 Transcript_1909/m.11700 type:complete len:267 (-) Transcript_1909:6207-7007(-)